MAEENHASRVHAMRTTLQTIEVQLSRGGVAGAGLEDLKAGVDDLRLRIWAIMSAASSGDPGALERFRLRRATEVCAGVADDVEGGAIAQHPEIDQLRAAAQRLLDATNTSRLPGKTS